VWRRQSCRRTIQSTVKIRFVVAFAAVLVLSPSLWAVTGFLFGPDGAPLSNVVVSAVRPAWPDPYAVRPDTVLATARTDAHGAFSLDVPSRQIVDVQVRLDSFLPVDLMVASDDHDIGIPLRAMAMREGKVTAGGKPVAGAKIVAANHSTVVSAVSDANGVYRLPNPAEWANTIWVLHPDFAPLQRGTTSPDYVLDPGYPIDGSVVDEAGKPVAGAEVDFHEGVTTKTGADGRFHFAHAPEAISVLVASVPGARAMTMDRRTPVLKLEPARRINGVVRDHAKQPVSGMVVMLSQKGGWATTTTDASGAFSFASASRESATLQTYESGGYLHSTASIEAGDANLQHDIEVPPAIRYEGKVVAADGSPRSGATLIYVVRTDKYEAAEPVGIASAPDGRFHFYSPMAPSSELRLAALSPRIPPASSEPIVNSSKPVVITVPNAVTVSASVIDRDNKPVAGVEIRPLLVKPPPAGQKMSISPWLRTDQSGRFAVPVGLDPVGLYLSKAGYDPLIATVTGKDSATPVRLTIARAPAIRGVVLDAQKKPAANVSVSAGTVTVKTGADGSFQLDGIPPGPASLRYGSEHVVTMPVQVPSLGLTLLLPGMKSVKGQVVDAATGSPVEEFDVVGSQKTVHSAGGAFEAMLYDDAWQLIIAAPGYRRAETRLDTKIVRLERAPILSGTVIGVDGSVVFGLTVVAKLKDAELVQSQTDGKGAFEFFDLAPGVYDLAVEDKDGNHAALKGVDVAKTHEVKLQLGKGEKGVIVGAVSGIQSARPIVSVTNGEWQKNVLLDASGNYRVEVPAGHVTLQLKVYEAGQSQEGKVKEVEVAPSTETRVDLALPSTVRLSGTVAERGAGRRFTLIFNGGPAATSATTGERGAYSIDVEPGTYDVLIADGMTTRRLAQCTVAVKEAMHLDFAIEEHAITVRVLDFDSGDPVTGAGVDTVSRNDGLRWTTAITSTDGTLIVNVPDDRPMDLTAGKAGYSMTRRELTGDESTVEFRIRNKPGVVVHLVDARNSNALSGYIDARQTDGPNHFFSRLGDESGVALPLPPGSYRISASADGYGSEGVSVRVPSADIQIPLPPGGALVIRAPYILCGAPARLLLSNGEEYVPCWCNGVHTINLECPRTEVDHITPGAYVLEVAPRTGDKRRIPVTITEGQVITVAVP
jgi:hypothetical protein